MAFLLSRRLSKRILDFDHVACEASWSPEKLDSWIPLLIEVREFELINKILANGNSLVDCQLGFLTSFRNLRSLNIAENAFTDAAASQLAQLSSLTYLNISYNELTDAGIFSLLESHSITSLDIRHNLLEDFQHDFTHQTRLKHVAISGGKIGPTAASLLRNTFLQSLNVELSADAEQNGKDELIRSIENNSTLSVLRLDTRYTSNCFLLALQRGCIRSHSTALTSLTLDSLYGGPNELIILKNLPSLHHIDLHVKAESAEEVLREIASKTSLHSCVLDVWRRDAIELAPYALSTAGMHMMLFMYGSFLLLCAHVSFFFVRMCSCVKCNALCGKCAAPCAPSTAGM